MKKVFSWIYKRVGQMAGFGAGLALLASASLDYGANWGDLAASGISFAVALTLRHQHRSPSNL